MKEIVFATLMGFASVASANPFIEYIGSSPAGAQAPAGPACTLDVDISGFNSFDLQGSLFNESMSVFLGQGAVVVGLAWDVNLTTFNGSWGSEAVLGFEGQINLTPGISDGFSVSNANYNSGGPVFFSDAGLPDITLGSDGILDIEFFESFDDVAGEADAQWLDGSTVTLYVQSLACPTPGSCGLFAISGLAAARRRRR